MILIIVLNCHKKMLSNIEKLKKIGEILKVSCNVYNYDITGVQITLVGARWKCTFSEFLGGFFLLYKMIK